MRATFLTIFAFVAACTAVIKQQQQVLITYPADCPQSEIDKAMDVLREAGGVISHEFSLIKGFAASASTEAIESIKALGGEFLPVIEKDSIVSIDGSVPDSGEAQ